MDSFTSTSQSLLVGLRLGDPQAWQKLVSLYRPLIYYWCRQADIAPNDTADIVQEVFRKVHGAIAKFRRDREGDTFRGWLRMLTRNTIIDHGRRTPPAPRGGTTAHEQLQQIADSEWTDADEERAYSDLMQRALEAIRPAYSERVWRAFELTVIHERPAHDVAQELGISYDAVRQAKSRILRRLREELGDD